MKLNNTKIDEFEIHLSPHHSTPSRQRVTPDIASTHERLIRDAERAMECIRTMDAQIRDAPVEGGEEGAGTRGDGEDGSGLIPEPSNKYDGESLVKATVERALRDREEAEAGEAGPEGKTLWKCKKRVDLAIWYLRKVHIFCYYCCVACESVDELERRCPDAHVRYRLSEDRAISNQPTGEPRPTSSSSTSTSSSSKSNQSQNGEGWVRSCEGKLAYFTRPADEVPDVWKHIVKLEEGRYGCRGCPKQFAGPEFVTKHLLKKHKIGGTTVGALTGGLVEANFFNNYLRDPNRLMPNSGMDRSTMNTASSSSSSSATTAYGMGMMMGGGGGGGAGGHGGVSGPPGGGGGMMMPFMHMPGQTQGSGPMHFPMGGAGGTPGSMMNPQVMGFPYMSPMPFTYPGHSQPTGSETPSTSASSPSSSSFIQAAPQGTPLDQIPRMGFGDGGGMVAPPQMFFMGGMPMNPAAMAAMQQQQQQAFQRQQPSSSQGGGGGSRDPRGVRSYVDLDAPASGDIPLNYG
ncbi:hypothetical protein BJ684DRAFT_21804 [Piptocephalis cylindrospora]|uniref:C2H2-type domain-containing protein n=1 Tax=Piptocephalis cylindrospora TaxID=1907219 RepID=A0A4P9Y1E5_9FUNG|nr:hypothetical protein BJ684DRAFT_21804 [Piptocephalis cylindrospora]|eukprot:RKP11620.1 hypothetical protein BJ684DRAFT_21804 [Piptocephalis cylindrospora]